MTGIPLPLGTETPYAYADRLLRAWSVDSVEADDAYRALGPKGCDPSRVADDVVDVLSQVRRVSGELHRPMIDCGHCWAERTDQSDRRGDWPVVICEECDEPWPCASSRPDTPPS